MAERKRVALFVFFLLLIILHLVLMLVYTS